MFRLTVMENNANVGEGTSQAFNVQAHLRPCTQKALGFKC